MSTEWREDRKCWIWRVHRYGKRYKGYGFKTKQEAQQAERVFLKQLKPRPNLPYTALSRVAGEIVIHAEQQRSRSRAQGLYLNLERFICPFFGAAKPVGDITTSEVEAFVAHHLRRVKPITVWHYVKDLRATLNYAIKRGYLQENPVAKADLSALAKRRTPKPPLSRSVVDLQSSVLSGSDRLYFDTLRFMGLRKDEGNCIGWNDIYNSTEGMWLHVRGTKTAGSDRWIPIPPVLWEGYRLMLNTCKPGELIFGRKGKKIYDRRKLFARAARLSGTPVLKPKDMRDYFASIMCDPVVASKMLGHHSLSTTAIYTRQVQERMVEGVANLGATFGGQPEQHNGASRGTNNGHEGKTPTANCLKSNIGA